MHYIYGVKISGDRELFFRELTIDEYKNLQKVCLETDITLFKKFANNMISELCSTDCSDLNIIDVYNILLNISMYTISDQKSFTSHVNGNVGTLKVNVEDLINVVLDKYYNYSDDRCIVVDIDGFDLADSALVDIFDDNKIKGFTKGETVYNSFNDDFDNLIPISIKNQIDNKISSVIGIFSEIKLLELEDESGKKIPIYFNLKEGFVYDFCKSFLKSDLKILYKNLYDLKIHLGIGFNEHKYMTLPEMQIYVDMFNKDQEKQSEKNKSNENSFPC